VRRFAVEHGQTRRGEFHERHVAHGVDKLRVYHQTEPVELVVVYMEGEDLATAFASHRASDHEFDRWFKATVEEIHGYHPDEWGGELPAELVVEWRNA
jgi:hypothetical protein